jgi:hypothetical protein
LISFPDVDYETVGRGLWSGASNKKLRVQHGVGAGCGQLFEGVRRPKRAEQYFSSNQGEPVAIKVIEMSSLNIPKLQ